MKAILQDADAPSGSERKIFSRRRRRSKIQTSDRTNASGRILQLSPGTDQVNSPEMNLREAALQIAALREANRHKNEFLAILGHELKNPLAGILNAIEVLEQGTLQAADAEEMRAAIRRQATTIDHLIDDLLDVECVARGKIVLKKKRLDLVQFLRDAVEDQRPAIERQGANLRVRIPEGSIWCDGDRTRLEQVVGNLLGNAAKFLNGSGEVTVELRNDLRCGTATIEIRDTGIGMEPQILRDIFQPFMQAERSREQSRGGLGIGLAVVKALVELHGGRVTAASSGVGRGSQFTVSLPTCGALAIDEHLSRVSLISPLPG